MTGSILTEMMELLNKFKIRRGIEAVVITTRNGITLTSSVGHRINTKTLAAMSSAMYSAADILIGKVSDSSADRVMIECKHSKFIIVDAGPKALLLVLANETVALGPLLLEMNNLTGKAKKLLEGY
ncbi:MAG: roadblock/LC7 domain-containing protein [Methanosarcinales archaeon]|nr:roadblock/LC7 domain-containing protein [ANME-2 cluster archaeon]MDF1531936.1 roadblock/LC7 domain-containing protein [ANME-2 cluster archaeon]MDW7776440.1 roadblock/LC7 domain-containing protein [Methanosarcinales archaeon]